MLRSRLLDRGRITVLVYPEIVVINDRGVPLKMASDTPVEVRCTSMEDRSSNAELPGQVTAKVIRFQARSAPLGAWARVVFNGEEWDVAIPPRFSPGVSRTTEHVEFTLRSRNKVGG